MQPDTERRKTPYFDAAHPDFLEMRHDVRSLKISMEKIADAMAKMAVLEEKHSEQTKALDRAFESLSSVKIDHKMHTEKTDDQLTKLNLRMQFVLGAAAAVSILWTVFGVTITDTVRETTKAVEQMKLHIATDRVLSTEDVRSIHKEVETQRRGMQ